MAKVFIAGTRNLKWKNLDLLKRACVLAQKAVPDLVLDLDNAPYEKFLEKIKNSYAVILVSLGDISPNLVLDALRLKKPVVLTQETGLRERLGQAVIWVDPQDEKEIAEKIVWLSDQENYRVACERVQNFSFAHSWREIATEFIKIAESGK